MMGNASNSRFRALDRSDATTAERFALRRCKTLAKDGPLSRPQEPEQGGLPQLNDESRGRRIQSSMLCALSVILLGRTSLRARGASENACAMKSQSGAPVLADNGREPMLTDIAYLALRGLAELIPDPTLAASRTGYPQVS